MTEPVLMPGKWISLRQLYPLKPRKTKVYAIHPKDGSDPIGTIEWYSPWRGYAFFPLPSTVFEPDCLGTIIGWLKTLNQHHRQHLKARKEAHE